MNYLGILQEYWGYTSFRNLQEEIIDSVCHGNDTLGLMPTGGGKSITFQVPALSMEGICIVVTPLIALMKDQVANLRKRNILATAVYTGMTHKEVLNAFDNCIYGKYKFLYISPERLSTELFLSKLQSMKVCMITVDECHCISQWGYDFRPAYLHISDLRYYLPHVPILALTATATKTVVKDIQEKLHFRKENVFKMSFERSNLAYSVYHTNDKVGELLRQLQNVAGSAIVYARSRKKTKEITDVLLKNDVVATFYHAGLDDSVKNLRQKKWQTGEYRVIVATNAFGMGIDKPDVRLVVHMDLPDSPEAYFQEAGRAGRDGQKAYAMVLYSSSDKAMLTKRIADTFPPKDYIRNVYELLQYYYQVAMGEGAEKMYEFSLEDFCRKFKLFPVQTDSALKILTQAGYIEYTDEQDNSSRLLFIISREELYKLHEMGAQSEALLQIILRSYTGVFTDYTYISEISLALRLGMTADQVYHLLVMFAKRGIIDYIPHKKTPYIIYTRERVDKNKLVISKNVYEHRKERYEKRIKAMIEYSSTNNICRSRMLLHYFGEENQHNCGICDVCVTRYSDKEFLSVEVFEKIKKQILETLSEHPLSPDILIKTLSFDEKQLVATVRFMLAEEIIKQEDGMLMLVSEQLNQSILSN